MEVKYLNASTWMRDSLHIIGHATLKDLTLPGTHDSAAYEFSNIPMPGAQSKNVERIINLTHSIIKNKIKNMETTQKASVYKQLKQGSRYFDIRAGWIKDEWYTYHLHVGPKLETILHDIRKFLDQTECEIVIIEISHFKSDCEAPNFGVLKAMLMSSLEDYMHPIEQSLNFTIFDMVRKNKRAIVCAPKISDAKINLWPNSFIKNTYPNKNKLEKIKKYNMKILKKYNNEMQKECNEETQKESKEEILTECNEEIPKNKYKNKLLKLSWILTPGLAEINKELLNLAKKTNMDLIHFFENYCTSPNTRFGNILIIDNFGHSDIMNVIYKANKIIR